MAEQSEGRLDPTTRLPRARQRGAERYPCQLDASCRLIAIVGDDFFPAKIRNISATGISLVFNRPLEPGTVLAVDLLDPRTQQFLNSLRIRVLYSLEHPSGDWILGGAFDSQLTPDELQSFLG